MILAKASMSLSCSQVVFRGFSGQQSGILSAHTHCYEHTTTHPQLSRIFFLCTALYFDVLCRISCVCISSTHWLHWLCGLSFQTRLLNYIPVQLNCKRVFLKDVISRLHISSADFCCRHYSVEVTANLCCSEQWKEDHLQTSLSTVFMWTISEKKEFTKKGSFSSKI